MLNSNVNFKYPTTTNTIYRLPPFQKMYISNKQKLTINISQELLHYLKPLTKYKNAHFKYSEKCNFIQNGNYSTFSTDDKYALTAHLK